jgi:5-methylcytosine-specific restriction endonuclease McrA
MSETATITTSAVDHHVGSGEPADPGGPGPGIAPLVPLERLEGRICELAGHLAAATARFLALVGEFDARRGWACWDLPSCAAWLAWKCQVAPGTAREQVRVARALRELPALAGEFAAGRMSYAKVRALTRIATPATDAELAEVAGPMTAAQCERFAGAHHKASDAGELAARAARRVRVTVADDGQVQLSAKLPAADGAVVLQALRAATGDVEHPHRPHAEAADDIGTTGGTTRGAGVSADTPASSAPGEPPAGQPPISAGSLADALVEVAGAYLAGKIAAASDPDLYQVVVHVGPEALAAKPSPAAAAAAAAAGQDTVLTEDGPEAGQQDVSADIPEADLADVSAGTSGGGPERAPAGAAVHPPADRQVTGQSPAQPDGAGTPPGSAPAAAPAPQARPAWHPASPGRCHLADGPAISPAAAATIACHASVTWMLHDHDGTLLDAGRRHRRATAALRRAVRDRDRGRCQFPGCNSRRTDIHHITAWARGGTTTLANLMLLCEAHHVIVHALGYRITAAEGGGWDFTRPDGQRVPSGPALPGGDPDLAVCHDALITAETIVPAGLADRFDLELTIWACLANASLAQQLATEQTGRQEQELAA